MPGSRSKFGNWTTVPSLYSWNIAECDVKPQATNQAYNFVLLYYRSKVSSICLNFCGSYACFELRILGIHSFPHFSLTCFDILSWHFAYDFFLLYYRSSVSVVNLPQFLWELCPFWNLNYWQYTVFRSFLWHAFDILRWNFAYHFVLLYYRLRSSVLNFLHFIFCRRYAPFGTLTACGPSDGKEVKDVFGRPGARVGEGSAR